MKRYEEAVATAYAILQEAEGHTLLQKLSRSDSFATTLKRLVHQINYLSAHLEHAMERDHPDREAVTQCLCKCEDYCVSYKITRTS